MSIRVFKYLSPISIFLTAWVALTFHGWVTWLPMIYVWLLIPLLELMVHPNNKNMEAAEEEISKRNKWYDYLLYIIVPLQYAALIYFIFSMQEAELLGWERAGRIGSMGLLCGTFGINVAHELGHRVNRFEQFLAKALLATSLYMHFFIEHNKGHHKNVATHEDPSSARLNEPVYLFYCRTIFFSYVSAWKIANEDCRKKGHPAFSLGNEMIEAHLWQLLLILTILILFGGFVTCCFLAAAFIGIILLETVNYIEHYGLVRKLSTSGSYERTMPIHSWNSSHPIGRVMLFELSRHSDHHYLASKKYQLLKHHSDAPQLPTGYPGSMVLSLVPPIWFYVMNKRIKYYERDN